MGITRASRAALFFSVVFLIQGCDPKKPADLDKSGAKPTVSGWIDRENSDHKIAVVFIHGIFGDAVGTWTNDRGKTFFSYLKEDPTVGKRLDIYAYGFESSMLGQGSLDIDEAANVLHQRLKFHGVLDYPNLVFVVHSMGGLVAMRYLIRHTEIARRVPLMVQYATPQEGAQIAAIADHVARNPALKNMAGGDGNSVLKQLDGDWKALSGKPYLACAYETADTYGVRVVPWTSSTRFCNEAGLAVGAANHLSIVKPDRPDHDSIILLVNSLQRFVTGKHLTAKLELPDFRPEQGHLVFQLNSFSAQGNSRLINIGGSPLSYTVALADPYLHVIPYPTPRTIKQGETELLLMSLGYGASKKEYRFTLKADGADDRVVVVRVADLASYQRGQAKDVSRTLLDLDQALSDKDTGNRIAELSGHAAAAERAIVDLVKQSIARRYPARPAYDQSILAAEILSAANWPRLSVIALRDAESNSQEIANAPAVQRLASMVAAKAGEGSVFARTALKGVMIENPSNANLLEVKFNPSDAAALSKLGDKLQSIPALEGYGLTLAGDLHIAQGNMPKAEAAYRRAVTLNPSPEGRERVEAIMRADKRGGDAPGNKSAVASGGRPALFKYDAPSGEALKNADDVKNAPMYKDLAPDGVGRRK